jgi:FAD/FMN-containing dehydrogenase
MPALRPAPARTVAPGRSTRRQTAGSRPVAPARRPALTRRAARPAELLAPADAKILRARFGEQLLLPRDAAYEAGRFSHNLAYDRRPAAIVRPGDAEGIAAAVRAARALDLDIAVRGGGHSVAGHSTSDGGLLIDLREMRAVDIDPFRMTGTAQGGATTGEYTAASQAHGLATPFGDTGNVGLGGLTLGGGIGWLARAHGMTIDNLLAVDLVTADGEVETISESSDAELFWALRGGGGNFGIAARFRYRLQPVHIVTAGALVLPLTRAVLRGVVDASLEAPDELTQISFVLNLPPAPFVPAELVGTPAVLVLPVVIGDPGAGATAMAPFRSLAAPIADLVQPMPYETMYQLTQDGRHPGASVMRSSFATELPDSAIDAIIERHATPEGSAAITQLRVLGGAMGRVPAAATAFAHRDAQLMTAVIAHVAGDAAETEAWVDAYHAQLSGGATGVYSNFLGNEGDARVRQAYPEPTYQRLAAVKRRVDPANVFRGNHNIRP